MGDSLGGVSVTELEKEIGKFSVVEDLTKSIGNGYNSKTFVLKNLAGEKKVLKLLKVGDAKMGDYEREKIALEKCSIAQVVKYEKTGVVQGFPYFLFPFIEGDVLGKVIGKKKFSEKEVMGFAKNMVSVIMNLNTCEVVHRDIKPDNIVFNSEDDFTLLDLGIALFVRQNSGLRKGAGPWWYLSPEQVRLYAKQTPENQAVIYYANDLFSLGLICLEMVFGKRVKDIISYDKLHLIEDFLDKEGSLSKECQNLLKALLEQSISKRVFLVSKELPDVFKEGAEGDETFWLQERYQDTIKSIYGPVYIKAIGTKNLGIILSGDLVQNEENWGKVLDEYRDKDLSVMVDPRTIRLGDVRSGYLGNRTYKNANEVKKVFDFEDQFNPTYYISPYEYVVTAGITMSRCVENFENFLMVDTDKLNSENTFFGIALKDNILRNETELESIIDMINANPRIKRIYVLFETRAKGSVPHQDKVILESIKKFFNLISFDKYILWSFADITAAYFLGSGLNNFSITPSFSGRKNDLGAYNTPPVKSGGQAKERIFSPILMNEILFKEHFQRKSAAGVPGEGDLKIPGYFGGLDLREERVRKACFIEFMQGYKASVVPLGQKDRREMFLARLEKAQKSYGEIRTKYGIDFEVDMGEGFIAQWKEVLK